MWKRRYRPCKWASIALLGATALGWTAPVAASPAATSAQASNVTPAADATNAVADLYVRYTEPRADDSNVASLTLLLDAAVNREELLVVLDDRAIAAEQLGSPLRVLAGAHRVRVEQLCANGVRNQSEFAFTVGPGDRYEHTIAVDAVLAPAALRTRGCCASTPNAATSGLALPSIAVLILGWRARRRANVRKHAGELPHA
jgi:hypothetical protein